jgi:DNA helicase HerA-like ATPase
VQQCVIDPEGDFVTLADRFGHVVVDAARTEAELTRIAARIRQHRVSVVLNLSRDWTSNSRCDAPRPSSAGSSMPTAITGIPSSSWSMRRSSSRPAVAGEVSDEARKLSLGAMTNLMCRGRKRGLAGVIATQRLAKLAKNVAAEASNFLMGRTFLDIDMARAADLLGMDRRQSEHVP